MILNGCISWFDDVPYEFLSAALSLPPRYFECLQAYLQHKVLHLCVRGEMSTSVQCRPGNCGTSFGTLTHLPFAMTET